MSDETRQFSPFDDDDDDRTQVQPNHPDGGPAASPDDDTVVTPRPPRPDSTSVMPQRDWAADDAAWAGRAEVRAPRPSRADWSTSAWDDGGPPPPGEPRGKWWLPIVLGIVGLVVLGALGWGIYLIANAEDTGGQTAPSASAPPPATRAETTPPTTAPTTTPPATPPTTETTKTTVTVPALVGLSQQEAQQALDRSGLTYRLIFRNSQSPAGTVIDSDPAEGQEVPADTQVTLVIATQRTTAPTSSAPTEQADED